MTEAEQILQAARSIVVVDWPSKDVPETLARAGYAVVVKGGPGPDSYRAHELRDGTVVVRQVGRPPDHADVVYSHRPLAELPRIVELAGELGAGAVWSQSGLNSTGTGEPKGCWVPEEESREARQIVESAGLAYVDDVYIADLVRELGISK